MVLEAQTTHYQHKHMLTEQLHICTEWSIRTQKLIHRGQNA
jgi:hypothetical protein